MESIPASSWPTAPVWGIEASIFFTFFGLYAILSKYTGRIGLSTVGNPAMRVPHAKGFPLPTILGVLPGMSAFATAMMNKEMEKLDIPPIPEFIEMIHDAGGKIYACKATVDMFHLKAADFCPAGGQGPDRGRILRSFRWRADYFHLSTHRH